MVQNDCPDRTLLGLHLTGARMRTWVLPGDGALPGEVIVVGLRTFASEEDAHGHFTGVSLQFGLSPGECTEPDDNVEHATYAGTDRSIATSSWMMSTSRSTASHGMSGTRGRPRREIPSDTTNRSDSPTPAA